MVTPIDSAATVINGHRVKPGAESQFAAWQHELNDIAATYPGFLGAEIIPPRNHQPDWVTVRRFDCVANVQRWLDSVAPQAKSAVGDQYLLGPPSQQVVRGAATPTDQPLTVVVSHRVRADHVDEFLLWQERLRRAKTTFEGYRGTKLFPPTNGVQTEWTTLYRYESEVDLQGWLTSDARSKLLTEGKKFTGFTAWTVASSFARWFAFDESDDEAPPPETTMALAVWMGLYPTVVLLTIALSPLHLPLWLGMLVGNLLSSFAMSFVTMPYYVDPLLQRWLRPGPNTTKMRNSYGIAIVVAVNAFWMIVFYLTTDVVWHLP